MENLIKFGEFSGSLPGEMPVGWSFGETAKYAIVPKVKVVTHLGFNVLYAEGENYSAATLTSFIKIQRGKTYNFSIKFKPIGDFDSYKSIAVAIICDGKNDGIFEYQKNEDYWVYGENKVFFDGEGEADAEIKLFLKYFDGAVMVKEIRLEETTPKEERWVRLAVVSAPPVESLDYWAETIDTIAKNESIDMMLLPETFCGGKVYKNGDNLFKVLSNLSKKYNMYLSATFKYMEEPSGIIYNYMPIFDRNGSILGGYYKNHPFDPESHYEGIAPGTEMPVFVTDFGKIGCIICYDSWFSDGCELLSAKGAELILFPSASFYKSLMPARSADNGIWIAAATNDASVIGVWDTSGRELLSEWGEDKTRHCDTNFASKDVVYDKLGNAVYGIVSIDLSKKISPHNWGGPVISAPGGRKTRRNQRKMLYEEILKYKGLV